MRIIRTRLILFLFVGVFCSKNLGASGMDLYCFDTSSEDYKNLLTTSPKSISFSKKMLAFALNGEEAALYTLNKEFSPEDMEPLLKEASERGHAFATNMLGKLYLEQKSPESVRCYDLAEERGLPENKAFLNGDTDFRFNYAFALMIFDTQQDNRTSHESLLKAWKLLKKWEEEDMSESETKSLGGSYTLLFERIKERQDTDLFLKISEKLVVNKPKNLLLKASPIDMAFHQVFKNTQFMDLLFQKNGTTMMGLKESDDFIENFEKALNLRESLFEREKETHQTLESVIQGNFYAALQNPKIRDFYKKIPGFQPADPSDEHMTLLVRGVITHFRSSFLVPPQDMLIKEQMKVIDNIKLEKILLEAYKDLF